LLKNVPCIKTEDTKENIYIDYNDKDLGMDMNEEYNNGGDDDPDMYTDDLVYKCIINAVTIINVFA
jgi:hypothetical protein